MTHSDDRAPLAPATTTDGQMSETAPETLRTAHSGSLGLAVCE